MMIRWTKVALLLTATALLLAAAPSAPAAQAAPTPQVHLNHDAVLANLKLPAKISFTISPNPSYFWSAGTTEEAGHLSWAGLPKKIEIHVDIGGPVYTVYSFTSLPFSINTESKYSSGTSIPVAVKVFSENGYLVGYKLYAVPVTNAVFNITMLGPAQPLLYKPVFNP
jgi:hypothetical protein